MNGSRNVPGSRLTLRRCLKRILFVLQLPGRMAFNTSEELRGQRDDCGRTAYNMAFWMVEEFAQFQLPAPPIPSAQQPGLSEAQLKTWVLGILRRLDDEDGLPKPVEEAKGFWQARNAKTVWDDIPAKYRAAIEQYCIESEAAEKENKRVKVEAFCRKRNLDEEVFRSYREQIRGRKRRGQS